MKKMKALGILLVMVLVLTACTNGAVEETKMEEEPMAEDLNTDASEEMMDKDTMENDSMDSSHSMGDDDMNKTDDTMAMKMNEGKEATGFELMDLEGNLHSLEDYKGEKVYVKFWASWCSICLAGLEELNELAGSDSDFKVLTIVTPGKNGEKNAEELKVWFNSLGYDNITVLLDEGASITMKYGVRGYPTAAYIGSDGILVKTLPGHMSNELVKESFEKVY